MPLIAGCLANLECWVFDPRLVKRYDFFVLEVVEAWADRTCKHPRTLHHRGRGAFMVAGETSKLASKMRQSKHSGDCRLPREQLHGPPASESHVPITKSGWVSTKRRAQASTSV